jgi:hypothetical protein
MDPTTIMAVVACAIVFIGWLGAPNRVAKAKAKAIQPPVDSEVREPVLEAV